MNFRKLISAGVISLAVVIAFVLLWPTFNHTSLLRTAIQERQVILQKRASLVSKVKQWQAQQKKDQSKTSWGGNAKGGNIQRWYK